MKQKITSDWDKLAFNGAVKKSKGKYIPFISRNSPYKANNAETRAEKLARQIRERKEEKAEENNPEIFQGKDGRFYYQPRIGGKFGKRVEISASLAEKLMG